MTGRLWSQLKTIAGKKNFTSSVASQQIAKQAAAQLATGKIKLSPENQARYDRFLPDDKRLFSFQQEASRKMYDFLITSPTHSCYNACEQGLGKCFQTVVTTYALSGYLNCALNTLIICPASVRHTWASQIVEWSVNYTNPLVISSASDFKKFEPHSHTHLIVSYALAANAKPLAALLEIISATNFHVLVMDESQYLKNASAKRTKAILNELWPRIPYRIALSGTPFTQSIEDGFTLFHRMAPTVFPNWSKFVETYTNIRSTPWGDKYVGVKNPDQLSQLIRKNFFIRYKKDDVLPDLPPKIYSEVTVPPEYAVQFERDDSQDAKRARHQMVQAIKNNTPLPPNYPACCREQGLKKLPFMVEYITDILENGAPTIIFAYHSDVIDGLTNALAHHNPVVIRGSTPDKLRKLAIEDFQSGKTDLFIGQIVAAGTGITLNRAEHVIIAEFVWSPQLIAQAVDRAHRIGIKHSLLIQYFLTEGSLETEMVRTLVSKARTFSAVVDNKSVA